MAKKAYVGVNNTAQEIKKIYIGVDGTARKVVKGYVGVNGVAQQFYPNTLPLEVKVTTKLYDAYQTLSNINVTTKIYNYNQ